MDLKRFFVAVKRGLDTSTVPMTSADIASGFDVTWISEPDTDNRLCRIGKVPATQFEKLKNKFNESGYFTMFEDIQHHLCN